MFLHIRPEALEATFSALADNLTGSEARSVRDFSTRWFSTSGSALLVTEFVTYYEANDTYQGNNVGFSLSTDTLYAMQLCMFFDCPYPAA